MITIATKCGDFVSVICSLFELPTLDLQKSGFFLGWSGNMLHVITVNVNIFKIPKISNSESFWSDFLRSGLWCFIASSSTICGTGPQKVEQVLKAGHCSTNCGTVPKFVEQLLLKVACYFEMWTSVPL